jgi:hypothetical protein
MGAMVMSAGRVARNAQIFMRRAVRGKAIAAMPRKALESNSC